MKSIQAYELSVTLIFSDNKATHKIVISFFLNGSDPEYAFIEVFMCESENIYSFTKNILLKKISCNP